MSNRPPFFLTGANAKIIVNNVTLALATDVSYKITVKHASPHVLGMYEAQEHQPLTYDVTGSFSIIRYLKRHKKHMEDIGGSPPNAANNAGNGIGAWKKQYGGGAIADILGVNSLGNDADGKAYESFVPERLYQSMMFDMEIRQQAPEGECTVARLRNCRIDSGDFRLDKKNPGRQLFTFKAVYVDEDTFTARKSGVGQDIT